MQMKKYLFSLLVIGSLVLSGCGAAEKKQSSEPKEEHASHSQQGDIQETTKGIDTLPTFLDKLDPQMKEIYTVAGKNAELLNWIPCYCGCACYDTQPVWLNRQSKCRKADQFCKHSNRKLNTAACAALTEQSDYSRVPRENSFSNTPFPLPAHNNIESIYIRYDDTIFQCTSFQIYQFPAYEKIEDSFFPAYVLKVFY